MRTLHQHTTGRRTDADTDGEMSALLRSLLPSATRRHTERRVLYGIRPEHLFRVIVDVDRYREFLPLCFGSQVYEHTKSTCGTEFDAMMKIGIVLPKSLPIHLLPAELSEEYVSRVRIDSDRLSVETNSVKGTVKNELFDSIRSRWKLRKLQSQLDDETGVDVEFDVEISVSNPVVAGVLDHVLQEVAGHQVKAFDERCRILSAVNDSRNNDGIDHDLR